MTGPKPQAELAFQHTVDEALRLRGCVTMHCYPLMTRHGWRTGTTLAGWPDLYAFYPAGWALFIEVKRPPNKLEAEQRAVLSLAARQPQARVWVVTPDDPPWETLLDWIKDPEAAPPVYGFEPVDDPRRELAVAELRRQQRKPVRRGARRDSTPAGTLPGL
jgi:hypothetical protein